jgi:hypothetical protein
MALPHAHFPGLPGVSLGVEVNVLLSIEDLDVATVTNLRDQVDTAQVGLGETKATLLQKFPDLTFAAWATVLADDAALTALRVALDRWLLSKGVVLVELQPVESSNVAKIGWRPTTMDGQFGDLIVEFKGSGLYVYLGVPKDVHEEMMASTSVGRFLNSVIKPNYEVQRVLAGTSE